jgi:hypothetical protein
MMTRKDYVETANILKLYKDDLPQDRFEDLVLDFASMFQEDNPRFLADKFQQACYEEAE